MELEPNKHSSFRGKYQRFDTTPIYKVDPKSQAVSCISILSKVSWLLTKVRSMHFKEVGFLVLSVCIPCLWTFCSDCNLLLFFFTHAAVYPQQCLWPVWKSVTFSGVLLIDHQPRFTRGSQFQRSTNADNSDRNEKLGAASFCRAPAIAWFGYGYQSE